MAGGSVLNNRVDNMLEVSRSIGDVWFKKSYQSRSFGFLQYSSLQRSAPNDPRQDVVIAEPDVKIYPLSSGRRLLSMLLCITR